MEKTTFETLFELARNDTRDDGYGYDNFIGSVSKVHAPMVAMATRAEFIENAWYSSKFRETCPSLVERLYRRGELILRNASEATIEIGALKDPGSLTKAAAGICSTCQHSLLREISWKVLWFRTPCAKLHYEKKDYGVG